MSETELRKEVEQLRQELAELRAQVATLVAPAPIAQAAAPQAPKPAAKKTDTIDEDTMLIISAAVAAFLGKRATIKLVRPVHQVLDGWRVQGRVAIHGSHSTR